MKEKIIKILWENQREVDSVQNRGITSDAFDKVADEIVKLFAIPDVSGSAILGNYSRCPCCGNTSVP